MGAFEGWICGGVYCEKKLLRSIKPESRNESKAGATDPHGVLTLRRSDAIDLHGRKSKSSHLLQTVNDTVEHGGTTTHNDVAVEIPTNIGIALHDGLEDCLVDARVFHAKETLTTIVMGAFSGRLGGDSLHLGNTDGLTLLNGGEGITTLYEHLQEVVK